MQLSPELLAQIQDAIQNGTLQLGAPGARSPLRPRQLHDLRLRPTKDDPRPTFFWSAESPRNAADLSKVSEFPKLMWQTETGVEITVISAEQQAERQAFGYQLLPPSHVVIDPMDVIKAQWESLSSEDQALLLESQKQDRIAILKTKLSALPEAQLQALLATKASEEQAAGHRGPGRPRKDSAA